MHRKGNYTFTSESVSDGHPDKLCDRVSDAVLDSILAKEPKARVACETFATTNFLLVGGEAGMPPEIMEDVMDGVEGVARECIRDIGYEQRGFHWKTCVIDNRMHPQSVDIARGVAGRGGREEGAGDQGIMFGHATTETASFMPAPIHYAHAVLRRISEARRAGELPALGPDAKTQLSVEYMDGKPVGVSSIVLSVQHLDENLDSAGVRELVEPIARDVLPPEWLDERGTAWHVNPTGKFVIGGPEGDAGLTGRKIIVDTYGGAAPHGGGAFSGKDPSKVDRSAAYAARYLAKNAVAAGLAEVCTIQLSYAIGMAAPLSVFVDAHGTGSIDESRIEGAIAKAMDLTPRGIRDHLGLDRPIYERTAAFGHFGREPEEDGGFSWERLDLAGALRANL